MYTNIYRASEQRRWSKSTCQKVYQLHRAGRRRWERDEEVLLFWRGRERETEGLRRLKGLWRGSMTYLLKDRYFKWTVWIIKIVDGQFWRNCRESQSENNVNSCNFSTFSSIVVRFLISPVHSFPSPTIILTCLCQYGTVWSLQKNSKFICIPILPQSLNIKNEIKKGIN